MRFDSCARLLSDYLFYRDVIVRLDPDYFPYLTREEIQEEKRGLIEECRNDFAFKILTFIEAEIRQNVARTLASRQRDALSKRLSALCDEFRRQRRDYSGNRLSQCKRIPFDDILTALAFFFKEKQDRFSMRCSQLKGYYKSFRNWYAHGRYFRHVPHMVPDPEDLTELYEELFQKVLSRNRMT
jgi:hypothetical protein